MATYKYGSTGAAVTRLQNDLIMYAQAIGVKPPFAAATGNFQSLTAQAVKDFMGGITEVTDQDIYDLEEQIKYLTRDTKPVIGQTGNVNDPNNWINAPITAQIENTIRNVQNSVASAFGGGSKTDSGSGGANGDTGAGKSSTGKTILIVSIVLIVLTLVTVLIIRLAKGRKKGKI